MIFSARLVWESVWVCFIIRNYCKTSRSLLIVVSNTTLRRPYTFQKHISLKISTKELRHDVNKNYVRLGYYTKISDNSLQTFRENSSARPESAIDKISPDFSKELSLLAA